MERSTQMHTFAEGIQVGAIALHTVHPRRSQCDYNATRKIPGSHPSRPARSRMTLATDASLSSSQSPGLSPIPEGTESAPPPSDQRRPAVIVVTGKFESLHLGHRALANRAAILASVLRVAEGQTDGILPAPRIILLNFSSMRETLKMPPVLPLASSLQTESILRSWCIPNLSLKTLPFPRIRSLSPDEFIALLQDHFGATGIVCGADWRFGYKASGDVDTLLRICQERSMAVDVMSDVAVNNVSTSRVSTTLVRQRLQEGKVELVEEMLGRRYRADGHVVEVFPDVGKISCGHWLNALPGLGLYEGSVRVRAKGLSKASFRGQIEIVSGGRADIAADVEFAAQIERFDNLEVSIEFIERDFHAVVN